MHFLIVCPKSRAEHGSTPRQARMHLELELMSRRTRRKQHKVSRGTAAPDTGQQRRFQRLGQAMKFWIVLGTVAIVVHCSSVVILLSSSHRRAAEDSLNVMQTLSEWLIFAALFSWIHSEKLFRRGVIGRATRWCRAGSVFFVGSISICVVVVLIVTQALHDLAVGIGGLQPSLVAGWVEKLLDWTVGGIFYRIVEPRLARVLRKMMRVGTSTS